MNALAAALAVALAADVVDVERAVATTDAGVLQLGPGCWLSDGRCVGVARELVQLRTENAELKKAPPSTVLLAVGAVTFALGLVLGGFVVWSVKK